MLPKFKVAGDAVTVPLGMVPVPVRDAVAAVTVPLYLHLLCPP